MRQDFCNQNSGRQSKWQKMITPTTTAKHAKDV
nr:MAG TPA: hypothetical protein [Caudoviricetes sp.]